jgi:hypothetical protein
MLSILCQVKINVLISSSNHLLNEGGLEVNRYENDKKWLKSRGYKLSFPQTKIESQLQRFIEQLLLFSEQGGQL